MDFCIPVSNKNESYNNKETNQKKEKKRELFNTIYPQDCQEN